jgi:hypothetical protein
MSVLVGVHAVENCSTDLCQCVADELSLLETAPGDFLAKQGRRSAVGPQCAARVALIAQALAGTARGTAAATLRRRMLSGRS